MPVKGMHIKGDARQGGRTSRGTHVKGDARQGAGQESASAGAMLAVDETLTDFCADSLQQKDLVD